MKFLYPEFLWALTSLSIPIIIHLFNFRRFKKIIFPNLQFLKDIQIQSQSRRQLKKWLILAARCLALTALVLAFARPYIPGKDSQRMVSEYLLSIYLDNSFSMNAEGPEGQLLETAKNRARELAKSYGESDRFQLLTNDFEGRHQRLLSKAEFLQAVDEVQISSRSRTIAEVYERQKEVLQRERRSASRTMAFQISDFQKGMTEGTPFQPDTLNTLYLVPLPANQRNNLSIDTAWISTPYVRSGENITLITRITNHGDKKVDKATLLLRSANEQKGQAGFEIAAGESQELELNFQLNNQGWWNAWLEINDAPVVFDDRLYLSFRTVEKHRVLVVNGSTSGPFLKAVYATDPFFDLIEQNINALDYSQMNEAGLLILNEVNDISTGMEEEISKFIRKGGDIYIIPPVNGNLEGLNRWLESKGISRLEPAVSVVDQVKEINTGNALYSGIIRKNGDNSGLPAVSRMYRFGPSGEGSFEPLLTTGLSGDLLRVWKKDRARIYVQTVPLNKDWSTLPLNFVFPSGMLQAALLSQNNPPLFYTLGRDTYLPFRGDVSNKENLYDLTSQKQTIVPEVITRGNEWLAGIGPELQEDGHYFLRNKGKEKEVAVFALNYPRSESQMNYLGPEELKTYLPYNSTEVLPEGTKALGATIRQIDQGTQLWKWCIVLALLFVSFEILLLRFLN